MLPRDLWPTRSATSAVGILQRAEHLLRGLCNSLFARVDKAVVGKLIGIITSLIVIIRIAEIFVDPLLGNLVDTPPPNSGDSALGSSSAVWCPPC